MPSKTREIALEVYYRSNRGGSYANILLPKVLSESGLEARDRSFVTELVYGALRMRGAVDFVIREFSSRPLEDIPPEALDALRLGAYQILYMGVPDRAAVNETVEIIKLRFHRGVASFANAVLRKISAEKDRLDWPSLEADPIAYLAVVESHPEWLVRMLVEEYGVDVAVAVCRADNKPPRPVIRANRLKTTVDELSKLLEDEGWTVSPGEYISEALIARNGGELAASRAFNQGLFYIQDESSMLAVRSLGAQPGDQVFDLCSGPGGKTAYLGDIMRNEGRILSIDLNPKRLALVKEACARMGVTNVDFKVGDVLQLPRLVDRRADSVLLDAPCSGLGVLASRPDARWRKSPEQIKELADLQRRMLEAAALSVKPRGTLVYSVCTLTREEGKGQVERFLKDHPEFKPAGLSELLPEALRPDATDGTLQLLPGVHKTNGMFIARMVRT